MRTIRRKRKMSQKKLSELSGVSLGSVKRFERSGEISFLSLIKITFALGLNEELEKSGSYLMSSSITAMSSAAIVTFDFSINRFPPVIMYDGMTRIPS